MLSTLSKCIQYFTTSELRCFRSLRKNLIAAADLDGSNVANAYVSGMKEDLHMYGTQYNVGL